MSVPVRTCIGCGAATARTGLVRLRIEGERVVVDRNGQGGRGAWLHPTDACLTKATRRRAFARAFRGVPAAFDLSALRVELTGSASKD